MAQSSGLERSLTDQIGTSDAARLLAGDGRSSVSELLTARLSEAIGLAPRYSSSDAAVMAALSGLEHLEAKWGARLPQLGRWVTDRNTPLMATLAEVAGEADRLGVSAAERGTLVHRIAELRTLHQHSNAIAAGQRLVEQTITTDTGRVELDLVTVHGDTHYIHDYKPINLAQILNESWGTQFQAWLDQTHHGDYRLVRSPNSMPEELREQYVIFLRGQIARHVSEIETKGYRSLYAGARGISAERVRYSIIPYWTWQVDR